MTKYFGIIFILISFSIKVFSNKVVSISDSTNSFKINYKTKSHNRTHLISVRVLNNITKNEYETKLKKQSIFKFNSYEFGEVNLSLKDYDKDGMNELLITNINQITDDNGNQIIFKYNQADKRYHEIINFSQLRSPQLHLGLNRIKEFDIWGDYNLEKYYSVQDNSIVLDSTVVSKYTFNSKEIKVNHKCYFRNSNTEYTELEEVNLSFNLEDTIETTPVKIAHKNFQLNLYFDKEKALQYLIIRNNSEFDLIRLNCKSVGIYLPMENVLYDSLKYINNDYDFNNDGLLDFIFPSTQYGDLYLFLIDPSTNQLYINPRITLSQSTFIKKDNILTTRSSNPCGTLPRKFTKYSYSINNNQFTLRNKIEVVEYRKRKKIYSNEKVYIFDGMNIKHLKTTNRITNQKM